MDEAAVDDEVAMALADAFPDREVEAVDPAGVSWNESNETVRVAFEDGTAAYLKLAVDGDPAGVVTERTAIEYVDAALEMPVPDVLTAAPEADVPYLTTAPLGGRPLHEVRAAGDADPHADEVDLARQVGAALARIHSLSPDGPGRIVGGSAMGLDVDREPWPDVLAETVDLLHERGPSDRFDGYYETVLSVVEDNRDLLAAAPATLLHGDPASPNTFLTPDGLGFIDWEVAHVGDPAYELVRACDQQFDDTRGESPADLVAAFHDGYREVAGGLPDGFERRRPVYEAAWYLTRLEYFDNYLEFLEVPEAELAEQVQAEMERRLAAL